MALLPNHDGEPPWRVILGSHELERGIVICAPGVVYMHKDPRNPATYIRTDRIFNWPFLAGVPPSFDL